MLPTGLHVYLMLLAGGCASLLASLCNSRHPGARKAICYILLLSVVLYLDWRLGHTGLGQDSSGSDRSLLEEAWGWTFLAVELLCLFELAVFFLTLSRVTDTENSALADHY